MTQSPDAGLHSSSLPMLLVELFLLPREFPAPGQRKREQKALGRLFLRGLRVRSKLETYIHSPARLAAGRVSWASRGTGRTMIRKEEPL